MFLLDTVVWHYRQNSRLSAIVWILAPALLLAPYGKAAIGTRVEPMGHRLLANGLAHTWNEVGDEFLGFFRRSYTKLHRLIALNHDLGRVNKFCAAFDVDYLHTLCIRYGIPCFSADGLRLCSAAANCKAKHKDKAFEHRVSQFVAGAVQATESRFQTDA